MPRRSAALAVAVLVAACAGAAPGSPGPSGPTATPVRTSTLAPSTPDRTPAPSLHPTRTPGESTPTPVPEPRFERVTDVEDAELYDVVAFAGGYAAGGCRLRPAGGCLEALIMHSPDGRTWTRAEVAGAAGRHVLHLAETPLGLFAFGSNQAPEPPLSRIVWQSVDGTRWEPVTLPAPDSIVFSDAVVLGDRTVLFGSDSAYDFSTETEAWSTADGQAWETATTPLSPKVAAHPGVLAIGDECVDVCVDGIPVKVFRSVDGLAWTGDPTDPVLAQARVQVLGAWSGRAVLGGLPAGEGVPRPAVWFDDPGGWRMVPLDDGEGFGIVSILDLGDRLLVLGRSDDEERAGAWWTVDGRAWHRTAADAFEGGWIVASAGDDPTVVLVGYTSIWASVS